ALWGPLVRVVDGERVEPLGLPGVTAGGSLQLAPRGDRDAAGVDQEHATRRLAVDLGDAFADGAACRSGVEQLLHALAHLDGDADRLFDADLVGEGHGAAFAHELCVLFDAVLDVLRIQVLPADDDQVL